MQLRVRVRTFRLEEGSCMTKCFSVKQEDLGDGTAQEHAPRDNLQESAKDDIVEAVVERIVRVHRDASLQLALDVGAIVVEKLYGGDIDKVRSRSHKDTSLRKLASHPKLPFSPATLWRCIGAYEIVRRFPAAVQLEHLTMGHILAVRALPPVRRPALLQEAAESRLPVAWLARRVAEEIEKPPTSPLPIRPCVRESVARIAKLVSTCSIDGDPGQWGERNEILKEVTRIRVWAEQMESRLAAE
jgi:hypothetical protein